MLTDLQQKFFLKLKIPPKENVKFEDLHTILLQMGHLVPYENIDIMEGNMQVFSRETIEEKLLLKNRGGLCYEINSLLYYFLCDCGFNVYRIAGTLYDSKIGKWYPDDGHAFIVLQHKNENYIIDAGFASYLPLHPVPFHGDSVTSVTGEYRVRRKNTEKGTYVFEMKKGKNGETSHFLDSDLTDTWSIGYAFYLNTIDEKKVNAIQNMVIEHLESPVNKGNIICKLIRNGHIALTDKSFTETWHGKKFKKEITEKQYYQILRDKFNIFLDI
ncbi:arylamine N-acetyltransferase [Bacillus thuringiensis]|uniref:arylamine N-acetyltransferase family protein n=2 Tax=Bacillus thuringiensis TaxID=1428 RepID=UPI0007C1F49F|nr:arylamine N-acetyltransferase [Bacillus thuringiensis]AND11112.1 acetyltransferase [Bacillus thuringiensis serovar alesti]MEC3225465.1 arylamine N-acetyltransferase [Bacillus thuringiensis]MEC3556948.1 arylamine N-acetyltransferase [Bacillus thuringiensis]MEC3597916.1 arylamine N-acetyltransferase [Bacillus thuringiensis]MED1837320.1 arylamine N-acetyltransferase [Bacillus thuringiensis]